MIVFLFGGPAYGGPVDVVQPPVTLHDPATVLFGLSMDYHIFLLSEIHIEGRPDEVAVEGPEVVEVHPLA